MTGFAVPGVNVVVPGVVVPRVVVPGDDGSFFFLSPAVPSPVVLDPAVPAPAAPGPVVAVPAGPGLPPGCCEKPGNACEGVPSLEGVPALAGVPGVPPGVPAALAGVAGRMSTTGLPGFAAMTPGPVSWAGCAVAAVCTWRVCSCVGGMWRSLASASCCGVGFTVVPPAPPLKLALDVLFTTTVLL